MTRYLLAAEADKIQDFIFHSSRLREVVGGSQLLTRFCEDVPSYLLQQCGGDPERDIIIKDGGGLRVLFDYKEAAESFGERLAEVYRRATGSSLTLAEPVEVNGCFEQASQEAEKKLRQAKLWQKNWQSQEQLPHMALCASCGTGLAVSHRAYYQNEEKQYFCVYCLNKSAEQKKGLGSFLAGFFREVAGEEGLLQADWPGKKKRRERSEEDQLEDIADYDPRRYVAYLLADGNDMGRIFDKCNSEQMRELSEGLTREIRRALAEPTKRIMEKNQLDDRSGFIPVLPLILGGDDLFALLPAPWALDFARCFCREYESRMAAEFNRIGLHEVVPTISAAVIVCKYTHPYTLARTVGEGRLKEAKRFCKQRIFDGGQPCSAVNFEVARGGQLVSEPINGEVRPTLRPYCLNDDADDCGLSLQRLLEQRWELRSVPNKRLAELQDLYDVDSLKALRDPDQLALWQGKLERLVKRFELRSKDQGKVLRTTLRLLGGDEGDYWRKVDRYPDQIWYGHGLPDLLNAWDFALSLEKSQREYEEG